jgi:hypothetical protein
MEYSPQERVWLGVLALVGGAGLNGVFLWALLVHPTWVSDALRNPVALAFVLEALVMVGVLAYLLGRWQVSRVHWAWFTLLALAGGIAFALPVVLLWRGNNERRTR